MSVNIADFTHVFELQINYKSGISVKAWFLSFEYDGHDYEWISARPSFRPMIFGAQDIESVWLINVRKFVPSEFGWNKDGSPML